LDITLLKQGLQRLIVCEGVGAVVLFGSRAQGTARVDSDLDLAVICQEPELTSQQRTQHWRTYRKALDPWTLASIWCCRDKPMPQDWPAPVGM
jgi:predicted nucleotidyltransferase